jgi:splicing factor 3A subunit 1
MVIQGIIRPPPEIRAVADRTALYVAKNGRGFESRILNSSKGQTPKFAFLHATSPFHAYYEDRIQYYEQNGTEETAEPTAGATEKTEDTAVSASTEDVPAADSSSPMIVANSTTSKNKQSLKASAIDPIAKALLQQRNKIAEYRKDIATASNEKDDDEDPPNSSSRGEPAPAHSTTTTTTARLPAPARLLHLELIAPKSLSLEHLEVVQLTAQFVALGHQVHFLDHITRAEWANPYFGFCQPRHALFPYFSALVDSYRRIQDSWTTEPPLTSSETTTPPPPALTRELALEMVAYRAEYERDQAAQEDDPSAKIDWHTFVVVETIDFGVDEEVVAPSQPPPLPPPIPVAPKPSAQLMDEVLTTEDGETIRVVPSYTPKVADARSMLPDDTIIDPITGKSVRVQDVPEHMRIQLLDPKWAEERKKFQEKQKESNLVSGDVVAANLERFSQQREDRFGKKEQTLLRHETDPHKKLEDEQRAIREQVHQNAPVGPTLPGPPPQKHHLSSSSMDMPDAKRHRVGFTTPANTPTMAIMPPQIMGIPPPPPPPTTEDPFAVGATGAMPLNDNESATTSDFIDEATFAASVGTADVAIQVRIPNDSSQLEWNYYGQVIPLSVPIMATVKVIKNELSLGHLNQLPVSKMQLKNVKTGAFLKDSATLAALNIGPGSMLEMVPRARGGKKK